ncbi:MAG TPA: 50S ribosomal protein L10 [Candidatus Omnitrophota bacterium]|jgi:large subunit ribosomal protein L10|nr:50S ribosomal protein L10 [Candidatus Omnitrophota bacterium]HPN55479.1 50S ribosomal protein L10 [Candidatus Omnitrophota bacterium]
MGKVGRIYREKLVESIKDGLQKNDNVFLLSYSAVSASQMNDLRKDLKRIGAAVCVSKNRIAQIALKECQQDTLAGRVQNQTAFVWSNADCAVVSKTLMKFLEKCETASVQGGVLSGAVLDKSDVKRLADLPSRDVLLSQLLSVIVSPLSQLASVLNGKTRELLSILKQLSEKKGGN